jgi:hypothetical protein
MAEDRVDHGCETLQLEKEVCIDSKADPASRCADGGVGEELDQDDDAGIISVHVSIPKTPVRISERDA